MATELKNHVKCDRCKKTEILIPNKDEPETHALPKGWLMLGSYSRRYIEDDGSFESESFDLTLDLCPICYERAEECFREAWYKAQGKLSEYNGEKND